MKIQKSLKNLTIISLFSIFMIFCSSENEDETSIAEKEWEMVDYTLILNEENVMRFKKYDWIGGLYKCFDEGIVNCRANWPIAFQQYYEEFAKSKKMVRIYLC